MAPTTPTGVPSRVTAGDSWRWKIPDDGDYPQSEGWSLTYELVGLSTLTISPVFQTSGDDDNHWLVSETLAITAAISAGRYRLIGRYVGSGTYAGREETVSDTILEVIADPRTADPGDYQTHVEKMVAILETSVETMVTDEKLIEQYGIAGRTVAKMPYRERVSLLGKYRAQLAREKSGRVGRQVDARFARVS